MSADIDLGPVLDDKGAPVSDTDLIEEAQRVDTIKFKVAGRDYKIAARKMGVPQRIVSVIAEAEFGVALEAGFSRTELLEEIEEIGERKEAGGETKEDEAEEDDPRDVKYSELRETSPRLRRAKAALAVASTVATNVPQFKPKPTIEQLAVDGLLEGAYIAAIERWWHPTPVGSEAETEPTPNQSTPAPSTASSSETRKGSKSKRRATGGSSA